MVLFVIFICAFAENTNSGAGRDSHYKSASGQHAYTIALNDAQEVSSQKSVVRFLQNTNFRLLNDCYKIINNNKSIHNRFLLLQKTELLIKPVLQQLLSFWFYSSDTGDLPDLS